MLDKITCIYGLFDPRSPDVVMYVGKGGEKRAAHHWKEFLAKGTAENAKQRSWFEKLQTEGIEPGWKFLEENVVDWERAEKKWIIYWQLNNPNLCNVRSGGNQVSQHHSKLGGRTTRDLHPNLFSEMGKKGGIVGGLRVYELHFELINRALSRGRKRAHELHPNLGKISAHVRWHVNRGIFQPKCELCQEAKINVASAA